MTIRASCTKCFMVLALCSALAACGGKASDAPLQAAKDSLARNDLNGAIIHLKNAAQQKPDSAETRFLLGKTLLSREEPSAAEVELRKARDLGFSADAVTPLLAKALLQQGDLRKLIEQFTHVTLETPAAKAELKTLLASAHAYQGANKEAEAALDAALEAVPGHGPATILRAQLLAGRGETDAAMSLVGKLLRRTPADPAALVLKGDLLLHSKHDWKEAQAAYRSAIAADSTDHLARSAIISELLTRNELDAARQELEALRKLRPEHPQTKLFDARLAYQKADYKGAEERVQWLLKVVPRDPQVLHLAAALDLRKGALAQAEQRLAQALAAAPNFVSARLLLAQTHLRSGHATQALDVIRPLLEAKEPSARALSLAGSAHMLNGDHAKAQSFFARAVKDNPADLKNRTALALARLSQSDGSAFGELESISQSDPGIDADMALVNAHLMRKNFDAASKALDRLEKKQPGKALPHFLRGRVQMQQGSLAAARASFEKAVALDRQFFPAVDMLAALDMRDKKPDDAQKRFDSLLQAEPNHVRALMAAARLRIAAHKPDEAVALLGRAVAAGPTDAAPRLMLIQLLLQQGDVTAALKAAQAAQGAVPEHAEVLGALGRAQLAAGDVNQAINSFNQAARLMPQSPLPLLGLADAHSAAGNKAEAARAVKRALALAPDDSAVQHKSMQLDVAGKRFDEAMATARNVQKQRPKQALGWVLEGEAELIRKNWPAAAAAYRTALAREPLPEIAQRLHLALRASGDPSQAKAMADAWMKSHPRDAAFVFYLGTIALLQKDYAGAERSFQQVIGLDPSHAGAINNLAWTTAQLKKPGALALAEKAHALRPDEPAFIDTLATILADENKLAKAIELQKKAVALRPQEPSFRLNLARIYVKSGDKTAARKELQQLSALGDKFAGQKEVQRLLAQL